MLSSTSSTLGFWAGLVSFFHSAPVVTVPVNQVGQKVVVVASSKIFIPTDDSAKRSAVDTKKTEKVSPPSCSRSGMTVVAAPQDGKKAEAKEARRDEKKGAEEINDVLSGATYQRLKTFAYPGDKADVPFCTLLCLPNGSIGYYVTYGRYAQVIGDSCAVEFKTNKKLSVGSGFLPIATMIDANRLVAVVHCDKVHDFDQKMFVFDVTSGCEETSFCDEHVVLTSKSYYGDSPYQSTYLSSALHRICALTVCPNGNIVTGSPHGKIKIWDTTSLHTCEISLALYYKCIKTIEPYVDITYAGSLIDREPTEELLCSLAALSDADVVYGLYDGTLKTLHLDDGKQEVLSASHAKAVTALVAISDTIFASGSADGTIKIWKLDKHKGFVCTQTLQGHDTDIVSLVVNQQYELFSLSEDGTINVWRFAV